jgi:hypothetical protein
MKPVQNDGSDEVEGFCLGFEIALAKGKGKPQSFEDAERRLDLAITESLSYCDLQGLETLHSYLTNIFCGDNPATTLETLWLRTKPTKVFFDGKKANQQNSAYLVLFEKVDALLQTEIASRRA